MSTPANKKKKAVVKASKKSSMIDRLKFMQKEKALERPKEKGTGNSNLPLET